MEKSVEISIGLSKSKFLLLCLFSIIFVILSALLTFYTYLFESVPVSPIFLKIAGVVGVLFFGFGSIFYLLKIFDKKPCLLINANGITDNSSAIAAGLIEWEDIVSIEPINIMDQNLMIIKVKDPQKYINRQKGFLKKKGMEINLKYYNSPLSLSANGLNCSFEHLKESLTSGYKQYT